MKKNIEKQTCWICGEVAKTGEHQIKQSDLKLVFHGINKDKPIIKSSDGLPEKKIQSIKSKSFHFNSLICDNCNSNRTQKYDMAWEKLSKYLHENWTEINIAKQIDFTKVFEENTDIKILQIQLYFAKIFACMVKDSNLSTIELLSFSKAILNQSEHNNFYLAFSNTTVDYEATISQIKVFTNIEDDSVVYAELDYTIGNVKVSMIYCLDESYMYSNRALKLGFKPSGIDKLKQTIILF